MYIGKDGYWTSQIQMQDWLDTGQDRYMTGQTGGMKNRSDAGQDRCRTGQMQDMSDALMQDMSDAVQDGCRTGQTQYISDAGHTNAGHYGYRTG